MTAQRGIREAGRSGVRDRILEVAGEVFAVQGADAAMSDIAAAAGCSRATLYRYFDSRRSLQLAYIAIVAKRISVDVRAALRTVEGREARLTESIVLALREVRADPALRAWFAPSGAGATSELALSSEAIAAIAPGDAMAWVVRVIVSLLVVPGGSEDSERALIARFVTPSVLRDVHDQPPT